MIINEEVREAIYLEIENFALNNIVNHGDRPIEDAIIDGIKQWEDKYDKELTVPVDDVVVMCVELGLYIQENPQDIAFARATNCSIKLGYR